MLLRKAAKRLYNALPHLDVTPLYTDVPASGARIPNHVYQTWVSPRLPVAIAWSIRRFRKMNADYSFSFFDNARMNAYMEACYSGHPILRLCSSDPMKQLRRAVSQEDLAILHSPQIGQSATKHRGLPLRIVYDPVERAADGFEHRRRRAERVDARGEVCDIAPVPAVVSGNLKDVSAVLHAHRNTPAATATISNDDAYRSVRVLR